MFAYSTTATAAEENLNLKKWPRKPEMSL